MTLRRKPLTAAILMIIMMKVFSGYTLTCHPAEYLIEGECCPKCPAGSRVKTDCKEFTNTSCLPCIDGTFMNQPTGRRLCFTCATCDAGSALKIMRSCTTTSDTVCEPLDGFYCIDSIENDCVAAQKHTSCQPGQYISHKGTALTDTVCTDCSSDTFSDGTLTYCQPHTQCESLNLQLIKPGTASTDAECGEKGSNTTVIIVICVVVLLVMMMIAVIVALYRHRKKKCFQISGKICMN
ncbi:hypothetical protein PAMP_012674 [Pampus punctatissimus]